MVRARPQSFLLKNKDLQGSGQPCLPSGPFVHPGLSFKPQAGDCPLGQQSLGRGW